MVAGFEQPTEGSIFLDGEPVEGVPPYKRHVNTVFQSYALFEHLDVRENVAFGLKRRKVDEGRDRDAAWPRRSSWSQLHGRADAKPRELSGGQRQRVALARALVNRPAVLLLDEPLGALDLKLRKQMQVELKQIQREVGITFVYVTHDQEEALAMSDRIAVMDAGEVIQCGTPEDVYEHPSETVRRRLHRHLEPARRRGRRRRAGAPGDRRRGARRRSRSCPPPASGSSSPMRPEKIALDEVEEGMVSVEGTVLQRVYLGMTTQVTVSLGGDARLVALDPQSYRASASERWEPGMKVRLGWRPEHCLVLR